MVYVAKIGFFSILIGCFSASIADEASLEESPIELILQSTTGSGNRGVVGDIDLGKVRAGSSISTKLFLKNGTDSTLKFDLAKPTCSCSEPKIPSGSLAAGEVQSQASSITIRIPAVRAKDSVLAEIRLLEKEVTEPVAKIRIRGTVDRPFYIRDAVASMVLNTESEFQVSIPIEVDPDLELHKISLKQPDAGMPVTASIERLRPGASDCRIRIEGEREKAITERSVSLQLAFQDEHWIIQDSVHVNFYDGSLTRVFPSSPQVSKGEVKFRLYRKNGFRLSELRCRTDQDELLDVQWTSTGVSLLSMTIKVPPETKGKSIILTDGDFEYPLPLVSDKVDTVDAVIVDARLNDSNKEK